jgi:DNA repair exonuclease SbcCD ATPase subunit
MQKLQQPNAPPSAIVEYKALQDSLNTNVWKYVYEARDLLRKDIITATVRLDRSAKANVQLTSKNRALQARIQQLEETVTTFEKKARASSNACTSLEKKLTRVQKDKDTIANFLSVCSVCDAHVQSHNGTLYCESCVDNIGSACENYSDYDIGSTDYEAQAYEENRQSFYDEALREAESEVNDILTSEAEAEAREIEAAIEQDQKEELRRVADQLEQIQELVECEAAEKKKKKKKLKKKTKKATSTVGESSSSN